VSAFPDSPKVSNKITFPSKPTYLCHPNDVGEVPLVTA